jgi:hypothetical protein
MLDHTSLFTLLKWFKLNISSNNLNECRTTERWHTEVESKLFKKKKSVLAQSPASKTIDSVPPQYLLATPTCSTLD